MKNYADLGGCYPPQPSASADNTLLDLHNSSYHTQPHPIIANYLLPTLEGGVCDPPRPKIFHPKRLELHYHHHPTPFPKRKELVLQESVPKVH